MCTIISIKKASLYIFLQSSAILAHTAPKLWICPSSKPPKTGDLKSLKNGLTVGVAVRCNLKGGKMQAALLSPASKSNLHRIRHIGQFASLNRCSNRIYNGDGIEQGRQCIVLKWRLSKRFSMFWCCIEKISSPPSPSNKRRYATMKSFNRIHNIQQTLVTIHVMIPNFTC